ncbi:MAG TPA: peptidylprolyl isomerase [Thermoanaerobaculia bacterium]|nr:peptidylprolyl isomerase [Thermoanaerobaculia bacterium]
MNPSRKLARGPRASDGSAAPRTSDSTAEPPPPRPRFRSRIAGPPLGYFAEDPPQCEGPEPKLLDCRRRSESRSESTALRHFKNRFGNGGISTAILLAAAALLAGACARRPAPPIDTIAEIDGRPVALRSFRAFFEANAGRPIAESQPAVVSGLFDEFLREETWRREAKLDTGDDNVDRREAPGMLVARAGDVVRPTDAEASEEYDRHPERWRRPEEAKVARIFTRTRPEAERARSRAVSGNDFGELARTVSRAPDAARGGALGWVQRGDLPSEFEAAVFRLKPDEVSPVIAAEEGFLVFKMLDRHPARTLSRDEAAPEIRSRLAREKTDRYLHGIVDAARREGRLRVYFDRLPFVYTGSFLPGGKES